MLIYTPLSTSITGVLRSQQSRELFSRLLPPLSSLILNLSAANQRARLILIIPRCYETLETAVKPASMFEAEKLYAAILSCCSRETRSASSRGSSPLMGPEIRLFFYVRRLNRRLYLQRRDRGRPSYTKTNRFTRLSDWKNRHLPSQLPNRRNFLRSVFPLGRESSFKYLITTLHSRNAFAFNEPPLLFVSSQRMPALHAIRASPLDRLTILCYCVVNFNVSYVPPIFLPASSILLLPRTTRTNLCLS